MRHLFYGDDKLKQKLEGYFVQVQVQVKYISIDKRLLFLLSYLDLH